jgi:YHS domain-containing protein
MIRYLCISCLLLAGCASTGSPTTKPACAECLVCKKNADLACVDVTVDRNTPRYLYNGTTYYFCSDDCKNEFAKDPQKYLKK